MPDVARPPEEPLPTRIVLRPMGTPLPLGFLALAGGTVLVSGLQLGWLDAADSPTVGLLLIAFVVPLQVVSSVLSFLARDVVAGTGMGILFGTWLAIGLVTLTAEPGARSAPLGTLLLVSAVAMLLPGTAALPAKVVPAAVLLTTSLRFTLTAAFQLAGGRALRLAAGGVGLVLATLAVYAALALVYEDARGRTVLPVLRRGRARRAMEGPYADQVARLPREAGVRDQL
ncbi:MAG TPA: GPR1/FUN34/YaaH family transporter [Miltoncostaeaceae bacterium]|nr:GPR1/FUN34/YaaH family transporter [Miltoncostaeaceae bacterium]